MNQEQHYYRGSLDPFEDIVEQLDRLGVAYSLMIGMHGQPTTNCWTNVAGWGPDGVESFDETWREVMAQINGDHASESE